ncbi:MAG: copper oxidase [Actinomycetota bacterium]|nr:copper oxidase [Actinomycetota bacterium]
MKDVPVAAAERGGQLLQPKPEGGVWNFDLVATPVRWEILPDVRVTAWTYNGTVPGPELRIPYGQRVRIRVKNELPEPTTVHWHGIAVPNAMDGVPDVTQKAIEPGGWFTYEFRAIPAGRDSKGGTFLYHSHQDEDRQLGLGLAGPLVIEPPNRERYDVERTVMIGEWNLDPETGETRPAMDMDRMLPNFFTLNGKSFPATEIVSVGRGDRVLLRLIGAGQFTHPMHLHGTDFRVVAKDGHPLATPFAADTIQIGSGERTTSLSPQRSP